MKLSSISWLRFFVFSFFCVAFSAYAEDFPSYFDLRLENPLVRPLNEADKYSGNGIVTPVRDQGYYGTCYAFAAIASFESNFYKQLKQKHLEDSQIQLVMPDFSEAYLSWLRGAAPTEEPYYTNAFFDHMVAYDESLPIYSEVVSGGNEFMSGELMRRTTGVAYESDYPHSIDEFEPVKKIASIAFMLHDLFTVEGRADSPNFFNIVHPELPDLTSYNNSRIKQMVTENGAVFIASCFSPQYVDINSGATFCPGDSANHAITIVGWDDEYDFTDSSLSVKPNAPGAWLIKNSWSDEYGDNGYFYISYEDNSLSQNGSFVAETDRFRYTSLNRNDKLGLASNSEIICPSGEYSIASRLKADDPQFVKAINFSIPLDSMSYELQIKKRGTTPGTGEIVYEQNGRFGENGIANWAGIRTIDLDKFIYMAKDEEYFAVVKLVAANGENRILLPISLASLDSFTSNEFVGYDKTYLKVEGDWTDYARSLNFEGKPEEIKQSVSTLLATYSKYSDLANGGNFTLLDLNDSSASATIYLGRADELYEGDVLNPTRTTLSDMTVEANTDSTYAGTIFGEGKLTKTGSAALTITGKTDYTGGTDINDGRFCLVNGTLYGDVNILASGTLQGNIFITGKLKNDGTVIPGNSIGEIVVTGDYVQNGALSLEGSLTGGDKITVLGDATINGAVNLELTEGYYPNGTNAVDLSKFIVAAGSIDYSAGYVLMPVISSTAVFPDYLNIVVNPDGTITATRDKAKFEASVLAGIGTIAGKDVSSLVFAAKPVVGEAQNLIADLENGVVKYDDVGAVANPKLHNTLTLSSIKRNRLISKFMSDKLIKDAATGISKAGADDIRNDENVFAFQFKSEAVQDSRTESAKYKSDAYGTIFGYEEFKNGWVGGLHFGFVKDDVKVSLTNDENSETESEFIGFHWRKELKKGDRFMYGFARVGREKSETARTAVLGAYGGNYNSDWKQHVKSVEVGYGKMNKSERHSFVPIISLNYTKLDRPDISETFTGGNAFALNFKRNDYNLLYANAGFAYNSLVSDKNNHKLDLGLSAVYSRSMLNKDHKSDWGMYGASVENTWKTPGRDGLDLAISFDYNTKYGFSAIVSYADTVFSEGFCNKRVNFELSQKF